MLLWRMVKLKVDNLSLVISMFFLTSLKVTAELFEGYTYLQMNTTLYDNEMRQENLGQKNQLSTRA